MRADIAGPLGQTAAGAIAEEVLRACVHCGMCNATCPTYQITGDELDGPRGRIYLIKEALEGKPVSALTQTHLDRCLSCRACETTCPSGVEYHRLLDIGRQEVAARVTRPMMQRLVRWAMRNVIAYPVRMGLMLTLGRLIRPALPKAIAAKIPQARRNDPFRTSHHARQMVQLRGCAQAATAPHFNVATARVLDKLGIRLIEVAGAGCCGALSFHLEAPDEARAFARINIDAWCARLDAGDEAVVINASGCAAFVRDYPDLFADEPDYHAKAVRIAVAVRDPIEILKLNPPVAVRKPRHRHIVFHESCTLRNGPALGGQVRDLMTSLGYDPQPVANAHLCCGSAGAYALLQPTFANRLGDDKLTALTATAPDVIYTANIGCWLHLGERAQIPVRHWIEAIDEVT